MQAWRTRLQQGTFLYRVEALQADAGRGARSASRIELLPGGGFGVSDILVADSLSPVGAPERWSDFTIAPNVGRVKRGKSFAMLWETYDLQKTGERHIVVRRHDHAAAPAWRRPRRASRRRSLAA